jgi:hypothetical protein
MDPNLIMVLDKSNVTAKVLPSILGADTPLPPNLTYGDLERIIKFVFQNNPIRWYDGTRYWKNSAFSLFNKYPAFDVTNEMRDSSRTYTLFPRLGVKPKVYLLVTDTNDSKLISACINYANNRVLNAAATTMINGKQCEFQDPPPNLANLSSYLIQASSGVGPVDPPAHVKQTMASMPKGGSNSKTKKARRTAHARNHRNHQV